MGVFDGNVSRAAASIAKKGRTVNWTQAAPSAASGDKPWNDAEDGEPATYTPKVVFFPPDGDSNATLKAKFNEPPEYNEYGFMAGNCGFEPQLTDTIERDGKSVALVHFDKLAPNGEPVLYTLWFKA